MPSGLSLLPGAGGLEGGAKRRHHHHRRRYVARRATRCSSDSGKEDGDSGQLLNDHLLRLAVVARNSNGVFLAGPRSENDVRVPPFRRCSPPPRGFVNEAADFVNGEGGDCEVRPKFPNRTLKKGIARGAVVADCDSQVFRVKQIR